MRAEDSPVIERALDIGVDGAVPHAESERPPGGVELLRLHGAEPRHHIGGVTEPWSCDALIPQTPISNRQMHLAIEGTTGRCQPGTGASSDGGR